jgi:hypothetical protein
MSFTAIDRERVRSASFATLAALKSAASLLGAVTATAVGGVVAVVAGMQIRRPDAVLLQNAFDRAALQAPLPTTVLDEKDFYLAVMALGAVILIGGLFSIQNWWRAIVAK